MALAGVYSNKKTVQSSLERLDFIRDIWCSLTHFNKVRALLHQHIYSGNVLVRYDSDASKVELNHSDFHRLQVWSLHSGPPKLVKAPVSKQKNDGILSSDMHLQLVVQYFGIADGAETESFLMQQNIYWCIRGLILSISVTTAFTVFSHERNM